MEKGSIKLWVFAILVLAALLIVGVYYYKIQAPITSDIDITTKQGEESSLTTSSLTTVNNESPVTSKEENIGESVKEQPGVIRSLKKISSGWEMSVDLLSYNPDWKPGGQSGGLYLNQNSKIRIFKVSTEAKVFVCGRSGVLVSQGVPVSMDQLISEISADKEVIREFTVDKGEVKVISQRCVS